jgi:HEAT repeat protein
MVLAVVSGEEPPGDLIVARGARGLAAERLVFAYLAQVRGDAAACLVEALRQRSAIQRVLRSAHSGSAHRRARAAERLGLIASAEAEARLTELITADNDRGVRIVATRALGKTASAAAARALLHSLSRPSPVPEGIVASALLELGPEAVPALRAELEGGRRQRAMAATVLGLLDELPAWPELVANVTGGDFDVRASAVRALGRLGLPQAAGAVAACLDPAEEPELRAVAARALGGIGDPRSGPALAGCLDDPHYWVAHNAAVALAALGEAGEAELTRAAQGEGSGAAHASEALARWALARGGTPAIPARAREGAGQAPAGQAQGRQARAGRLLAGRVPAGRVPADEAPVPADEAPAGQAPAGPGSGPARTGDR